MRTLVSKVYFEEFYNYGAGSIHTEKWNDIFKDNSVEGEEQKNVYKIKSQLSKGTISTPDILFDKLSAYGQAYIDDYTKGIFNMIFNSEEGFIPEHITLLSDAICDMITHWITNSEEDIMDEIDLYYEGGPSIVNRKGVGTEYAQYLYLLPKIGWKALEKIKKFAAEWPSVYQTSVEGEIYPIIELLKTEDVKLTDKEMESPSGISDNQFQLNVELGSLIGGEPPTGSPLKDYIDDNDDRILLEANAYTDGLTNPLINKTQKLNSSGNFSSTVSGINPISFDHLTTKNYVDSTAGGEPPEGSLLKGYIDDADTANDTYSDANDVITLQAANDYTDSKTLEPPEGDLKDYIDDADAVVLQSAIDNDESITTLIELDETTSGALNQRGKNLELIVKDTSLQAQVNVINERITADREIITIVPLISTPTPDTWTYNLSNSKFADLWDVTKTYGFELKALATPPYLKDIAMRPNTQTTTLSPVNGDLINVLFDAVNNELVLSKDTGIFTEPVANIEAISELVEGGSGGTGDVYDVDVISTSTVGGDNTQEDLNLLDNRVIGNTNKTQNLDNTGERWTQSSDTGFTISATASNIRISGSNEFSFFYNRADFKGNRIQDIGEPIGDTDATTKNYVDDNDGRILAEANVYSDGLSSVESRFKSGELVRETAIINKITGTELKPETFDYIRYAARELKFINFLNDSEWKTFPMYYERTNIYNCFAYNLTKETSLFYNDSSTDYGDILEFSDITENPINIFSHLNWREGAFIISGLTYINSDTELWAIETNESTLSNIHKLDVNNPSVSLEKYSYGNNVIPNSKDMCSSSSDELYVVGRSPNNSWTNLHKLIISNISVPLYSHRIDNNVLFKNVSGVTEKYGYLYFLMQRVSDDSAVILSFNKNAVDTLQGTDKVLVEEITYSIIELSDVDKLTSLSISPTKIIDANFKDSDVPSMELYNTLKDEIETLKTLINKEGK